MEEFDRNKPPTKFHTYTRPKRVGFCPACKQPIYKDERVQEEYFDSSGEGYEWLRRYVQQKLLESGVIPSEEANPANPFGITSHIVHDALRIGSHKTKSGQFACIEAADDRIAHHIKCPPSPISAKRFSLTAFTEMQQ